MLVESRRLWSLILKESTHRPLVTLKSGHPSCSDHQRSRLRRRSTSSRKGAPLRPRQLLTRGTRKSAISRSQVLRKSPYGSLSFPSLWLPSFSSSGDSPMACWTSLTSTFKMSLESQQLREEAFQQRTLGEFSGRFGHELANNLRSAYFIGPLTYSGYICRKFGYRWTFITGLLIYGVGALMFWPSGVKRSFGGFCGSMFIVGSGLSTLETAANPYIAVCGPPRYSEIRLNLSQSFQAIGTVVAPLLASRVIFANVGTGPAESQSLQSVQFVYLGVACFV